MNSEARDFIERAWDESNADMDEFVEVLEDAVSLKRLVEHWPNDAEKRTALKRLLATLPTQYVETLLDHMGYIKKAKVALSGSVIVSNTVSSRQPLFGSPDEILGTPELVEFEPEETEQERIARITKQMCGRD